MQKSMGVGVSSGALSWAQFSCNYGLESVQLQRPAGPELSQLTSIVVVAISAVFALG